MNTLEMIRTLTRDKNRRYKSIVRNGTSWEVYWEEGEGIKYNCYIDGDKICKGVLELTGLILALEWEETYIMECNNGKVDYKAIFVYGSLMPGFDNYSSVLQGTTTKEVKGEIKGVMYDLNKFPAIDVMGEGIIKGYVMYIHKNYFDIVMEQLDLLEGYNDKGKNNLYNRVVVNAVTEDGCIVECYTYTMGNILKGINSYNVIEEGDWELYNSSRPSRNNLLPGWKFTADKAVMTASISHLLDINTVSQLVNRHYMGDWGEVHEDDKELNDEGIESGEALLSVFKVNGTSIWVYTEWDRSVTTVLLPSDW